MTHNLAMLAGPENSLTEWCVYAMWELESKDPEVYRYMRPGDIPSIPLGFLKEQAEWITANPDDLKPVEQRIFARAVSLRLET